MSGDGETQHVPIFGCEGSVRIVVSVMRVDDGGRASPNSPRRGALPCRGPLRPARARRRLSALARHPPRPRRLPVGARRPPHVAARQCRERLLLVRDELYLVRRRHHSPRLPPRRLRRVLAHCPRRTTSPAAATTRSSRCRGRSDHRRPADGECGHPRAAPRRRRRHTPLRQVRSAVIQQEGIDARAP